jgi:hypothetical protein
MAFLKRAFPFVLVAIGAIILSRKVAAVSGLFDKVGL